MNIPRTMRLSCLILMFSGCSTAQPTSPSSNPSDLPARSNSANVVDEDQRLKELSELLRKGTRIGELSKEEKQQLEDRLQLILPSQDYIGERYEWERTCHDNFIHVNLRNKDDNGRAMWFHILHLREKPDFYGSEDFGRYRGMGMKNVHYFILVGNLEIRAVAASEEYKDDRKIKDMLRAFRLSDIEKL